MNSEPNPDRAVSSEANSATPSVEGNEHEHVSDQVQLEAQKLVDLAGSPELARKSIEVVEQRRQTSPSDASRRALPTTVEGNDEFLKALRDFETSLATPVVSGELIDWVTTARLACEHLGVLLLDEVQRTHADLYYRIIAQDPELSSRVEKLRAADEQLSLVDFDNVTVSLSQLFDRAQSAEQDELKVTLRREDVVKQALAFVISARTQETAIGTWFSEAFNRDRGFGD